MKFLRILILLCNLLGLLYLRTVPKVTRYSLHIFCNILQFNMVKFSAKLFVCIINNKIRYNKSVKRRCRNENSRTAGQEKVYNKSLSKKYILRKICKRTQKLTGKLLKLIKSLHIPQYNTLTINFIYLYTRFSNLLTLL